MKTLTISSQSNRSRIRHVALIVSLAVGLLLVSQQEAYAGADGGSCRARLEQGASRLFGGLLERMRPIDPVEYQRQVEIYQDPRLQGIRPKTKEAKLALLTAQRDFNVETLSDWLKTAPVQETYEVRKALASLDFSKDVRPSKVEAAFVKVMDIIHSNPQTILQKIREPYSEKKKVLAIRHAEQELQMKGILYILKDMGVINRNTPLEKLAEIKKDHQVILGAAENVAVALITKNTLGFTFVSGDVSMLKSMPLPEGFEGQARVAGGVENVADVLVNHYGSALDFDLTFPYAKKAVNLAAIAHIMLVALSMLPPLVPNDVAMKHESIVNTAIESAQYWGGIANAHIKDVEDLNVPHVVLRQLGLTHDPPPPLHVKAAPVLQAPKVIADAVVSAPQDSSPSNATETQDEKNLDDADKELSAVRY
jgi:hypothetical protein